jgi:periplasmic protein TonB
MLFVPRAVIAGLAAIALVAVAGAQEAPQVYKLGAGVKAPRLVKEFKPKYSSDAMDAGIQGTVELDAIVGDDGKVGDVQVTRSLDTVYGLDEAAVECVKQWLFRPGTKDGKPVAVQVAIEITFTLRR